MKQLIESLENVLILTDRKQLAYKAIKEAITGLKMIEREAANNNKEMKEAIEFYQKGVGHFFKCINWGKSFLDAEAIQFMNEHEIKFSKAINKNNG